MRAIWRLALLLALSLTGNALAADWRKEIGTFRVGMVRAGAPTQEGLDALRKSLSAALGMPVDFFIAKDFAMLVDAQASSRIEYAIYSATAYATAQQLCDCVEPLAAAVDVDEAAGIRTVLIGRADKVSRLSDLPTVRLAIPSDDSMSGWLAPLALLSGEGIKLGSAAQSVLRTETTAETESAFISGQVDALLGWERATLDDDALPEGGTIDRLRRAGVDPAGLDILWRSPLIRYGPHTVRKSIAPEAKAILTTYLLGLHAADPQAYDLLSGGHGGGFVAVDDKAYAAAKDVVRLTASGGQ